MKTFVIAVIAALAVLAGPAFGQAEDNPRLSQPSPVPLATGRASDEDSAIEVAFWTAVKESDDPMLYLAYLERYPEGAFRVLARNRLEELWQRATRAFALLDELGIPLDPIAGTLPGTGSVPGRVPAVTPPPPPPVVVAPPVVVTPKPSAPPVAVSAQLVRNVQNQLRKHQCYKGGVDGVWGDISRSAMQRFNRRAGTDFPTRRPTEKALSHMRNLTRSGIQICR